MSSALGDDTRATLDAGRETAGAMLRAAQKDLQKVFIFFLVGFLGTFYALRLYVWDFLKTVTRAQMSAAVSGEVSIIAQTPFDVILLQAKIGLVVGVVLAVPSFVYFSRDALKQRNLWPSSPVPVWQLAVILVGMVALFVAGVAYGYYVFFPFTFSFLASNAIAAGFSPTYSIVKWAQFIFLLTASFGLASQLPLAVTGLSYAEIVPYETFRDKWRYAVAGTFVVGALFTPPDPFTQIMWAIPVLTLYGLSLYLAKIVTTARRGSEQMDVPGTLRGHWNTIAGTAAVGGLAVYAFFARGGVGYFNAGLDAIGSGYFVFAPSSPVVLGAYVAATAVAGGAVALGVFVYRDLDDLAVVEAGVGDPAAIDLDDLDPEPLFQILQLLPEHLAPALPHQPVHPLRQVRVREVQALDDQRLGAFQAHQPLQHPVDLRGDVAPELSDGLVVPLGADRLTGPLAVTGEVVDPPVELGEMGEKILSHEVAVVRPHERGETDHAVGAQRQVDRQLVPQRLVALPERLERLGHVRDAPGEEMAVPVRVHLDRGRPFPRPILVIRIGAERQVPLAVERAQPEPVIERPGGHRPPDDGLALVHHHVAAFERWSAMLAEHVPHDPTGETLRRDRDDGAVGREHRPRLEPRPADVDGVELVLRHRVQAGPFDDPPDVVLAVGDEALQRAHDLIPDHLQALGADARLGGADGWIGGLRIGGEMLLEAAFPIKPAPLIRGDGAGGVAPGIEQTPDRLRLAGVGEHRQRIGAVDGRRDAHRQSGLSERTTNVKMLCVAAECNNPPRFIC